MKIVLGGRINYCPEHWPARVCRLINDVMETFTGPDFEQYLNSKKIDSERFKSAEPDLWLSWKREFEQMHPNSFTIQKLNLINAIRRKYLVTSMTDEKKTPDAASKPASAPVVKPGKPLIKPKGG